MFWGSLYTKKWILSLFGGLSSLVEALYNSRFSIDLLSGWHLTSKAIVNTLLFPFPYPILFMDISNAGSWIGSHSLPSWNLLVGISSKSISVVDFLFFPSVERTNVFVSSEVNGILHNASSILDRTSVWRVIFGLTNLMKPIDDSRCVEILFLIIRFK